MVKQDKSLPTLTTCKVASPSAHCAKLHKDKCEWYIRLTKKESHRASPIVLVAHRQRSSTRQISSTRQRKRSCCTLTACLACARSPLLRTLSATQSPQCGYHCPSPLFSFLGKWSLYMMTQYLCGYAYVCVLIPDFFNLVHSHYTKAGRRFYNYLCGRWG